MMTERRRKEGDEDRDLGFVLYPVKQMWTTLYKEKNGKKKHELHRTLQEI